MNKGNKRLGHALVVEPIPDPGCLARPSAQRTGGLFPRYRHRGHAHRPHRSVPEPDGELQCFPRRFLPTRASRPECLRHRLRRRTVVLAHRLLQRRRGARYSQLQMLPRPQHHPRGWHGARFRCLGLRLAASLRDRPAHQLCPRRRLPRLYRHVSQIHESQDPGGSSDHARVRLRQHPASLASAAISSSCVPVTC